MSEKGLSLLAKLFQNSGEGIMLFNKNGLIESMNPRAEDIFGYKEDELIGKPIEVLVPEKVRHSHKTDRNSYLENPKSRPMGLGLDLKGLRKDGDTFPIEISLNYLKHENEMMVVAFITDITVRKQNERMVKEQQQKLEEYANELEKKVRNRTSELEHMNLGLQSQIQERKLAEQALKKSLVDLKQAEQEILASLEREKELGILKSRFVSMASHEFRTPLTTILSSANLIQRYSESEHQNSREKHIGRIQKNVQHLTTILNDFLSLEKLESGAQKINKSVINIKILIDEIIEAINPTLKVGQRVESTVQPVDIMSDEYVLKNILINLISNASKYSSGEDVIELTTHRSNGLLSLSVKDHGIGIPVEEQKNLFERFFRAANVTNIQGTGLGLNIVKKYVELLNGTIDFKSAEGKGSTFTIHLPTHIAE